MHICSDYSIKPAHFMYYIFYTKKNKAFRAKIDISSAPFKKQKSTSGSPINY